MDIDNQIRVNAKTSFKKLLNETNDTSVLIVSSYQLGIGVIFSIFKYICHIK